MGKIGMVLFNIVDMLSHWSVWRHVSCKKHRWQQISFDTWDVTWEHPPDHIRVTLWSLPGVCMKYQLNIKNVGSHWPWCSHESSVSPPSSDEVAAATAAMFLLRWSRSTCRRHQATELPEKSRRDSVLKSLLFVEYAKIFLSMLLTSGANITSLHQPPTHTSSWWLTA